MGTSVDTVVVTRFHYPKGSKEFDWRLGFYQDYSLPELLNQTDQGFDIAVWCESWHEDQVRALSDRITTFQATYTPGYHAPRYKEFFADFTEWENVDGLRKYKIQAGLDSDDIVSPHYIHRIHKLCHGDRRILVSFHPELLNSETGYIQKITGYSKQRPSAFFAFYQPDLKNYRFLYCDSHTRLHNYVDEVILVPEGECYALTHDHNDSTRWYSISETSSPYYRKARWDSWLLKTRISNTWRTKTP